MKWRNLTPKPGRLIQFNHIRTMNLSPLQDSHGPPQEHCYALADCSGNILQIGRTSDLMKTLHQLARKHGAEKGPGIPDRAACLPGSKTLQQQWQAQQKETPCNTRN